VSQIRMNPAVVQNVVTYDAIIDFGNPELKLFPGMTAYVTIPVATANDVLKLPDAALQFKPALSPDEIRALYRQNGIGDAAPGTPSAVVWKLEGGNVLKPVQLALGITDHAFTAVTRVVKGELREGDPLVTRSIVARRTSPTGQGGRR
jgi:HlyD family secretion protein